MQDLIEQIKMVEENTDARIKEEVQDKTKQFEWVLADKTKLCELQKTEIKEIKMTVGRLRMEIESQGHENKSI